MKRRRLVAGVVALSLLVIVGYVFWPRGPRPCLATFQQVREGMTRDEVITVVGGPPGIYTDKLIDGTIYFFDCEVWLADDGELWVIFGKSGWAETVSARPMQFRARPPLWIRVRDRLGL
jgi:hypothetical protein